MSLVFLDGKVVKKSVLNEKKKSRLELISQKGL